MPIEKPMLAKGIESMDTLDYPFLGTPKIDGHRTLRLKIGTVTRKFHPFPNRYIRETLDKYALVGFDGEVVVEGLPFHKVSSLLKREIGAPDFTFMVFDYVINPNEPYSSRVQRLENMPAIPHIKFLIPTLIRNKEELILYEQKCVDEGYEGVIIRKPDSPYKFGRSTLKQGWMLKIKRFTDAEAKIIGFFEGEHNNNEATIDALGYTKRSSCQAGKVLSGTLGGFIVKDIKSGVEFRIGNGEGLDSDLRGIVWKNQKDYIGKIIKYKYQEYGTKDKPRIAKFVGFREEWDMD